MTNPTETMGDVISKLEKENAALKAMLKRWEWCYDEEAGAFVCVVCLRRKPEGHGPTCALAALLKGEK